MRIEDQHLRSADADRAPVPADQTRKVQPRKATPTDPEGFPEFWIAYPRKVGRGAARKAWIRIEPGAELRKAIMEALAWQVNSRQWRTAGGKYIPHPATWLNQERWADGPTDLGGQEREMTLIEANAKWERESGTRKQ